MHKRLLLALSSVVLLIAGARMASADTIVTYTNPNTFGGNDVVHWNSLGANVTVPDGFTVYSVGGVQVTGTFKQGGSGATVVECPGVGCTFTGNFAPGEVLLFSDLPGQGPVQLSFSPRVYGAGFQIESDAYGAFDAELQAFDGSTLLDTFFLLGNSNGEENNSAIFLGLKDLTGPDITSIKFTTFDCTGNCKSFAVNRLLLQTTAPSVPEPGALMLLSSGLGALGFLRRKLAGRLS